MPDRLVGVIAGKLQRHSAPQTAVNSDIHGSTGPGLRQNGPVETQIEPLTDARYARPELSHGQDEAALSLQVLTIALSLALWVTLGSFVLALGSLGGHPVRRLSIGILFLLAVTVARWRRDAVCAALRAQPSLVVLVAVVSLGAAVADGVDGPYLAITETAVGLAAVVARPRTVWLCVAVLETGYATASALASAGSLGGRLGAALSYPFMALVALGLAVLYRRFLASVPRILIDIQRGAPALTPALTRAIELGHAPPVTLLPAPEPMAGLSPHEFRVVEALAHGTRPKELAYVWGVSLATVRKHIRLAKRKTGARTLPELAAMVARRDRVGVRNEP